MQVAAAALSCRPHHPKADMHALHNCQLLLSHACLAWWCQTANKATPLGDVFGYLLIQRVICTTAWAYAPQHGHMHLRHMHLRHMHLRHMHLRHMHHSMGICAVSC
jgi:hypothetical protein